MKKTLLQEIGLAIIVIALGVLLINPSGSWMPEKGVMVASLSLIITFGLFGTFIWRERARDERENMHRLIAGRIAFLSGAGVLVLGITVESISKTVDPWLVASLTATILGKIIASVYLREKK
ncbi:MAG: hypothetical protein COU07_02195 [Candidatus Harrisonbacteria bacterium CG10_big_fil_rev_8_21_14_0_10_40_38]|uniref:Uncharacterized protein n=1 Tax=Candidatus Harrisonbacteria bacterium CG10_big_fil_rev_8_21_14_0_10_40_38 TaxID=1974583 RepID=A0A2H0US70_9BACT|nr:MAG: hypothetical protein COU07_02195 [Candidatus Harrisonbacteria bacterium CG10_big_fil_rev_8_21_14_0_10_40_38]